MPQPASALVLSKTVKPVCPRNNHEMHYEEKGILVQESQDSPHHLSSYHCGYYGCGVRYTPADGYFSVIDAPDVAQFIEEPGSNFLQCPRHGSWLYRQVDGDSKSGFAWRCGVEGCDYEQKNAGVQQYQ